MMGQIVQVTLPEELDAEVKDAVARGEYKSEDEAICAAVSDWREQRMVEAIGVDELRRLVEEGIASGPGRFASIEEIKAEARKRFDKR